MHGEKMRHERRLAALRDPQPWDGSDGSGGGWRTNRQLSKKAVKMPAKLLPGKLGYAPLEVFFVLFCLFL